MHFTPIYREGSWYAKIKLVIASLTKEAWDGTVNVTLKNGETEAFLCSETCSMKENEDELTIETDEIACKAVSAWAPEHPTLYQVTAQLQDESGWGGGGCD